MIRFAMTCLLAALLLSLPAWLDAAPPQPVAGNASFELPGRFSEQTSVADLEGMYGKANMKVVEAIDDASGLQPGVVLFPDDPLRRAHVQFHDSEALAGLRSITVSDAGSVWRGKRGVHVGMPFSELRRRNAKPFWFSGFDSRHRGMAHDQWSPALDEDDGKLGALDVDGEDRMYFGVELGLRGQGQGIPADAYPGEGPAFSDDPRYPRLGELVVVTAIVASTSLDDEWD